MTDTISGPEERYGDNFTRLIRWNISNPGFQQAWGKGGLVLSHTDNIGEPPFQPENMIMVRHAPYLILFFRSLLHQAFSLRLTPSLFSRQTDLPPSPTQINNGQCSSTCTTTSHMLKWQGKVKSIAFGGRPQPGPMQAVGGVKGKQVCK